MREMKDLIHLELFSFLYRCRNILIIYIFRIISTIEGYSLLGHNETNNADNEYSVSSNAWILIIFIFVFVMELSSVKRLLIHQILNVANINI